MQRQVRVHAPGEVRVDEMLAPEPGPRDAVVRVAACGICGSDVGYVALGGVAGPTLAPMPLGHELSGVVESIGSEFGEVDGIGPGTRVVVNPLGSGNRIGNGGSEGGFAPRLLVRNAADGGCLIPIPDSLSFEAAALAEPLGVGMEAVDRVDAQEGESAAVFGAGPIGLSAIASLRDRGVEDVVAIDLSETRLAIARKLGARETLNPARDDVFARLRQLHGESPVLGAPMAATDVYIEASGAGSVIGDVLGGARSRARMAVVALHRQPLPVSLLLLMMKEISLVGSMAQPDDWTRMLDLLGRGDLLPMITHRFALGDFEAGMAVAQDAEAGAKVMIDCMADGASGV
jgi:(R,R)-butanediol dehydrogenase/meso-butanediol dehydrogenase/diacetyl reductase